MADSRCRLRVLVLNYNEFEAEDIALIADGLAVNRSLRELSLEGNVVQGIGAKVILAKGRGYGMGIFCRTYFLHQRFPPSIFIQAVAF